MSISLTQGVPFSGTIKVGNATSATVSGLPAGLSASALSGDTITVSGTPTASGTFDVKVDATNACGGGSTTSSATNLAAGSGTVAQSGGTLFGGLDCCGLSVSITGYVPGTTVITSGTGCGSASAGSVLGSTSNPLAVQQAGSPFGFAESGSCSRPTIIFLDVNGNVVDSIASPATTCLDCP